MDILTLLGPNVSEAFLNAVKTPAEIRMDAYKIALRRFDWHFEAAEGRAYLTAKAVLEVLRAEQRAIDPTGEIWLSIMPKRSEAGPQPPLPEVV